MRFKFSMSLAAALLASVGASASAQNLIQNGGFESGDLTNWTIRGLGNSYCPGAPGDFIVSTNGAATGCNAVSGPHSGSYAAYNMFDGPDSLTYTLRQSFIVPNAVTSAQLGLWYTINNQFDPARSFGFNVFDAGNANIFSQVIATGYQNVGWTSASSDLTALLAANGGQNLTLELYTHIASTWTGPAGMGLDDVSLNVEASATPEPASLLLIGTGLVGVAAVARRKRRA